MDNRIKTTKRIRKIMLLTFFAVSLWFGFGKEESALAAINPMFRFEGKVTNTDGSEIADGVYDFNFDIH